MAVFRFSRRGPAGSRERGDDPQQAHQATRTTEIGWKGEPDRLKACLLDMCARRIATISIAVMWAAVLVYASSSPASADSESRIAFVREPGIWVVMDGIEHRLTRGSDYRPDWSPDGKWLLFQRFDGDGSDLYRIRADGNRMHALTDDGGYYHPSWSPDGKRIAFGQHGDLYVMDADGSNRRRLTGSPGEESRPAWSPDGTEIAFVSGRGQNLWIVDAYGSSLRPLTRNAARDQDPAWSPNGRWIMFARHRPAQDHDLFLIRADGSGAARQLTTNGGSDWSPAWSPDGTRIAFTRARYTRSPAQSLLVVMDLASRERERLAISSRSELEPDWASIQ